MKTASTITELERELNILKEENRLLKQNRPSNIGDHKRLSALFHEMQMGVLVENNDRVITRANSFFCELFGIPDPTILVGMNCESATVEASLMFADPKQFIEHINKILVYKKLVLNQELKLKDGRVFERDYIPVYDNEAFIGNMWVYRDITNRYQSELDLKTSEIRWKFAVEGNKDGLWDWDLKTNTVFFSSQWKHMIGYDDHEIKGTIEEWEKRIHPDDLERVYHDINKHLLGKTDQYVNEHRMLCKDNSYKWVLDRGKIIDYDEKNIPIRMIGIHSDISARKKAEREIRMVNRKLSNERNMFMQGNVIVFKWKNTERWPVNYVSPNVESILGYKPDEIKSPKFKYSGIVHPEHIKQIETDVETALNNNADSFEHEPYRLFKKDGSIMWVNDYTIVIRDENGEVTDFMGYIVDITDLKETQQALIESQKKLIGLNATKDKFFSIIAHDLRSPFSALLGFSDIIINEIRKKRYHELETYMDVIKDTSNNTLKLLENLLEWAYTQTDGIQYEPENMTINSIIHNVTKQSKNAADQKHITVKGNINDSIIIYADKNMITTVVRNLVSNAIKYTKDGGVIEIIAKQDNTDTHVTVKDNGIGIKPEKIKRLFKAEENVSTLGTNNETGTGLGLLLCYEFIKKHNGKIWVDSVVDRGTSFHFTIPVTQNK
jgi:PAS domain S-box-containing protein